jgi:hypothetical protein
MQCLSPSPKTGVMDIKDFWPISLVGGVYKFFFFYKSKFISKSASLKGASPNYSNSITKNA